MTVSISITGPALDKLQSLPVDLSGERQRHAAGRGVRRLLMDYFRGLDATRANQLGGKRTHYYADAARNIDYEIAEDGAMVHIHKEGIALHYHGGTVKPTGGRRFLTIPVDPEAYGHTARDFNNLEIAWGRTRGGKPRPIGLVTRNDWVYKTRKNRKTGAQEVVDATYTPGKWMFALVMSATIHEDKTVLPEDESIQTAALSSISDYVISRMRGHA